MEAYLNEALPFRSRAEDLVARMTLGEKVSQMLHTAPAIKRLGIPAYNWWNEGLHGVARAGVATVFPQCIGLAASFDPQLLHQVADCISTEGRARYAALSSHGDRDIYKGLTFWAPNVNIFRDPRWGRGHETLGEDPYLTAELGKAFVRGMQGDDPKYLKTAACAKHYAVHSGPESIRHSFNAEAGAQDLWDTYLYAFSELVRKAKVEGVMGAYNRVNGVPCCGNQTLLQDILREKWDFQGYTTSDCWAIKDFHEGHGVTSNILESVALAVNSGCELNCGNLFGHLEAAVQAGMVSEATIDACVTDLMTTRMKLGMFDAPEHVPYTAIGYAENDSETHRRLNETVARRSLVLLKNDGLLPLDVNKLRSVAVIGPNADSRDALVGNYYGTASEYVTILEGIRERLPEDVRLFYAEGCHLFKDRDSGLSQQPDDRIAEAVAAAERADAVILCLGLDASLEGEEGDASNAFASGDKPSLDLPGRQQHLLERVCAAGKPVVLVLATGSALAIGWADEHVPAILNAWYPGAQGGRAVAAALFGAFSPSGRLPVTFYRTTEELPEFTDYSMENRTYRYMKNQALYPFGYGLSYTAFTYGGLALSADRAAPGETVHGTVTVRNTGAMDGGEAVQVYLRDEEASERVPRWKLAAVRHVFLRAGESAEVSFDILPRQMALIDRAGGCVLEPGVFTVYAGGSQPDERSLALTGRPVLHAQFTLTGEKTQIEY